MSDDDDESDSMADIARREREVERIEAARRVHAGSSASRHHAVAHTAADEPMSLDDESTLYEREFARFEHDMSLVASSAPVPPMVARDDARRSSASAAALPPPTPSPAAAAAGDALPLSIRHDYDAVEQQARALEVERASRTKQSIVEHATYLIHARQSSGEYMGAVPETIRRQPQNESFVHAIGFVSLKDRRPRTLDEADEQLLRSRVYVSTRAYEESFLREPRDHEPACASPHCKGLDLVCAGGGSTLVAFMSPDEWERHTHETSAAAQRLPNRSLRCLLCQRFGAMAAVAKMRAANIAYRPGELALVTHFYNLTTDNEYRDEDCLLPDPHVYEGFFGPIVLYDESGFERVTNAAGVHFRQLAPTPAQARAERARPQRPHFLSDVVPWERMAAPYSVVDSMPERLAAMWHDVANHRFPYVERVRAPHGALRYILAADAHLDAALVRLLTAPLRALDRPTLERARRKRALAGTFRWRPYARDDDAALVYSALVERVEALAAYEQRLSASRLERLRPLVADLDATLDDDCDEAALPRDRWDAAAHLLAQWLDAHWLLLAALEDEHARLDDASPRLAALLARYEPSERTVLHEGALPASLADDAGAAPFFAMSLRPRVDVARRPMAKLFSKVAPANCRPRDVLKCAEATRPAELALLVLASLLGVYRHARSRSAPAVRARLYRRYLYGNESLLDVLVARVDNTYPCQRLVVAALAEALVACVPADVRAELCARTPWRRYQRETVDRLDRLRERLEHVDELAALDALVAARAALPRRAAPLSRRAARRGAGVSERARQERGGHARAARRALHARDGDAARRARRRLSAPRRRH